MQFQIQVPYWPITEMTGYKPLTTFWQDFSIAERFGLSAIKETYKSALEYAKLDHKYLTELVLVLNHKIWQHYEVKSEPKARVYDELWRKADAYALRTLKGDEMAYYYDTLD